ncbi:MAG: cell division protein FtsQ/DivIB [Actinomycetota bacterium]
MTTAEHEHSAEGAMGLDERPAGGARPEHERSVEGAPLEQAPVPERFVTDPRLSRRRKAVQRSRRRRAMARSVVVASIAVLVWAAFWSPLLSVRAVKVLGARHTTAGDVGSVAGLDPSDNLLLLSTSDVARRVSLLPWVKDVRVERMLPGTVKVSVTERRPSLTLETGAGRWAIDARGRVLTRGGAAPGGLPVLTAFEGAGIEPGSRLVAGPAASGLKAYRGLAPFLRRRVIGIFAPTVERVSFSLESGLLVRFGAAERVAAKNRVLRALLTRIESHGSSAAYIDVRVPESPAISSAPPPDEEVVDSTAEPPSAVGGR